MSKPRQRTPSLARRRFVGSAVAALAGGSIAGSAAAAASAQASSTSPTKIAGLSPAGAPAVDIGYSPGILAEGRRLVYVSGQGSEDVKADMETQVRQTFQRIGRVLEAAGATFANVVMIRSYFIHLARDLPVLRKVRLEFLAKPYPASTAVGVTELAIPGLEIEIEAIAVL